MVRSVGPPTRHHAFRGAARLFSELRFRLPLGRLGRTVLQDTLRGARARSFRSRVAKRYTFPEFRYGGLNPRAIISRVAPSRRNYGFGIRPRIAVTQGQTTKVCLRPRPRRRRDRRVGTASDSNSETDSEFGLESPLWFVKGHGEGASRNANRGPKICPVRRALGRRGAPASPISAHSRGARAVCADRRAQSSRGDSARREGPNHSSPERTAAARNECDDCPFPRNPRSRRGDRSRIGARIRGW